MSSCVPPPTKATSAASTAANRRSTRSALKEYPRLVNSALIKAYRARVGLGPMSGWVNRFTVTVGQPLYLNSGAVRCTAPTDLIR